MKNVKKMALILLTLIVGLSACEKKTECGECIDPSIMGGSYIKIYQPVCGCDNKTYNNSSQAMAEGGVTSWTDGPCEETHEDECVDLSLIRVDYGIDQVLTVAESNGFTIGCCIEPPQPVCGCDGVTYNSASDAKYGHGIKNFTFGPCEQVVDDCIDSSLITVGKNGPFFLPLDSFICKLPYGPNVELVPIGNVTTATTISELTIAPDTLWVDQSVCGCNGETYNSGYEATNVHGVKSYTPGPCMLICTW
jgi:hypothetical protein